MTSPSHVNVSLGERSYDIVIGSGLLGRLGDQLATHVANSHVVVFTDSNVGPIYLEPVVKQLETVAAKVSTITVAAGETSKSVSICDGLWQQMIELGADRRTIVIALGGGVVGDLAGFVAASFTRGLNFIQIPTTLLAQVDSSVGGKVGINLPQAKNMVGAFWQPQTVVIDIDVLKTLPDREFAAGMAEVIKYGVIMDASFFDWLESRTEKILARDPEFLTELIATCCQCKAKVVEEDEKETSGRRAILNYGHTFGHAVESVFGYGNFLHGEAISIGMVAAARMAKKLAMVDQDFCDRQLAIFEAVSLPVNCPPGNESQLVAAMKHDKKVALGKLRFVLPTKFGEVVLVDAPDDDMIGQCYLSDLES